MYGYEEHSSLLSNLDGDLDGVLTRDAFWTLCKFRYPTHQICLCTEKALRCLEFVKSYEVINNA